ncbi:17-beta-hydroxysteroid dehydrogenase type 2 [Venturia canescens]|uniref:17-beta-hydroxysteroid dehydrogenase type 2 n=1 Tax=Venturia canescens TaxID=32260 RepID=UPI001C9BD839|nr:17-beta-hydroxysteroid dehydrogenase type 2 [Venturia canescens]
MTRWYKAQREEPKERQVVLVTGCDTGLGFSLALYLSTMGFRVVASVHKSDSAGAIELSKIPQIFVHQLDLTISESVQKFGAAVRNYLQQNQYNLRGFVNNAGVMIFGEFEWQSEEQTRHQIEVNLVGTMRVTREFMPTMRKHRTRLIIVTSHCAGEPLPGVATYGATKAALSAWATALRVELKKYHIDVVNFVPGSFIRESNLLSQQASHFEKMYSAMDQETRAFYGDYFTRYANYLSAIAPNDLPRRLMDRSIYNAFEGAILDREPKALYRAEPKRYMFYRIMFKISPTKLRDYLVVKFINLPEWKAKIE